MDLKKVKENNKMVDVKNPKNGDVFYMANMWNGFNYPFYTKITITECDGSKDHHGNIMFRYLVKDENGNAQSYFGNNQSIFVTLKEALSSQLKAIKESKEISIKKHKAKIERYDENINELIEILKEVK